MKNTILLTAIFSFLCCTAKAQDEYAFYQVFKEKVRTIEIQSGWTVKLVPRTDDSTFFSLISNDIDEAQELTRQDIFLYSDATITLRRASTQRWGRRVEIHTNFENKDLVLMPGATVYADSLTIPTDADMVKLNEGSALTVRRLMIKEGASGIIEVNDANLTADTLAGGRLIVNIHGNGRLQVQHYRQRSLVVNLEKGHGSDCYTLPDPGQSIKTKQWIEQDTIGRIRVNDIEKRVWSRVLHVYTSAGIRPNMGPNMVADFLIDLPIVTEFQLGKDWSMKTGLDLRYTITSMSHKVTVDGNGYLQLADTASHYSNIASSWCLGIPVIVTWSPFRTQSISFSADLFAGLNAGSRMAKYWSQAGNTASQLTFSHEKISYLNPFKLELGLSLNERIMGHFQFRLFANLLPEYRNVPELPKCHTYGMEIRF